jgi:Flp pilus assembly protein TadG
MIRSLFKTFRADRRAAVALAVALVTVPMMILMAAALDFSRLETARVQLQQATDSAAMAATGAWQTSQSVNKAMNAANAAFDGSARLLPNLLSISAPSVSYTCTVPSALQTQDCLSDGTMVTAAGSTYLTSNPNCPTPPTNGAYCVIITATATMQNTLIGFMLGHDALTTVAGSEAAIGTAAVNRGNFSSTSVGLGSDLSAPYAYAVPQDSNGNSLFTTAPSPNTNCQGGTANPLGLFPSNDYTAPPTGTTNCNYLEIGSSISGITFNGSFTLNPNDLVAFSFVNFTGGSFDLYTSGANAGQTLPTSNGDEGDLDAETIPAASTGAFALTSANKAMNVANCVSAGGTVCTHYTSYLHVTALSSVSVNGTTVSAGTLTYEGSGACMNNSTNAVTALSGSCGTGTTQLYAYCPAHNLYGSIEAYFKVSGSSYVNIVPTEDSIHTYYSVWMAFGYPPTHGANAAITPFLGPLLYFNGGTPASSSPGTGVSVTAICPQWQTPATSIGVTQTLSQNSTDDGSMHIYFSPALGISPIGSKSVKVFATYYPDTAYTDTPSTDIYPPPVAGCTPVTSSTALTGESTTNPWWGWSPDNGAATDPNTGFWSNYSVSGSHTDTKNCTSVAVVSGGTLSATAYPSTGASTSAPFTAAYNNCTMLLQPLGNNVLTLPNWWTYTATLGAFAANTTGNPENVTSMAAGTGAVPGSTAAPTITNPSSGVYTVKETPANGTAQYLPADTSHHCYNPQANGNAAHYINIPDYGSNPVSVTGDNNNGGILDPVANPQDGVVYCDSGTPPSYGLYWNDMGSWSGPPTYNDDIGYTNAISDFTCPVPGSGVVGGPSSLF